MSSSSSFEFAHSRDTIVAIATAAGASGIGVVRLSGDSAATIAQQLTQQDLPKARQAVRRRFYEHPPESTAVRHDIDEGLLLYFPAPHSYTGETVVECQIHGSPVALTALLSSCLALGARLALAGEFTQRAFLHGKLDLCTAEAVGDLIHASTKQAARSAAQSLSGAFSLALAPIVTEVVDIRAKLEANLDFADEAITVMELDEAQGQLQALILRLRGLLDRVHNGMMLQEGLQVVIIGSPNVGKSSLLNALAQEPAALVSDLAGTTRDSIERRIAIHGVPCLFVDTAGLRDTTDPIEQLGIARTHQWLAQAQVIVHLTALTPDGLVDALAPIPAHLNPSTPRITVINKWDRANAQSLLPEEALPLSVHNGFGLESFKHAVLIAGGWSEQQEGEPPFSARLRHVTLIQEAIVCLEEAHQSSLEGQSEAIIGESLRFAHRALQGITGEFGVEDLLGEIFGRFCIGK